jgi:hypothetical protein
MESTTPANSAMKAHRPHRRRFLGAATMTVAAAQLAVVSPGYPALRKLDPEYSLGAMKQIDAGVLNVGYADLGPKEGPPVILLHGWPYDVHSFVVVAPLLASEGYRVSFRIFAAMVRRGSCRKVRYATGNRRRSRPTSWRSWMCSGSKARSSPASTGGRGRQTSCRLVAERCKAMVSVSGYLIGSQELGKKPLPPKAELEWWYQYYFATDRGRVGYEKYRHAFAKLIWQLASPKVGFR